MSQNRKTFEFTALVGMLGRPATDAVVRELLAEGDALDRIGHQAHSELLSEGITIVLVHRTGADAGGCDEADLRVDAVHLHRDGHEGYSAYTPDLLGGIALGDLDTAIAKSLGPAVAEGGGGISPVLKRPIPRWLKYRHDEAIVHLQLDSESRLEMVTLMPLKTHRP